MGYLEAVWSRPSRPWQGMAWEGWKKTEGEAGKRDKRCFDQLP